MKSVMARKQRQSGKPAKEPPSPYTIRFPDDLRERIERDAKKNYRKLSDHILWVIAEYLASQNNAAEELERKEGGNGA